MKLKTIVGTGYNCIVMITGLCFIFCAINVYKLPGTFDMDEINHFCACHCAIFLGLLMIFVGMLEFKTVSRNLMLLIYSVNCILQLLCFGITFNIMKQEERTNKSVELLFSTSEQGFYSLQKSLECCGVHSFTDYHAIMNDSFSLPSSCCAQIGWDDHNCNVKSALLFDQTCAIAAQNYNVSNLQSIEVFAASCSALMILGVVLHLEKVQKYLTMWTIGFNVRNKFNI